MTRKFSANAARSAAGIARLRALEKSAGFLGFFNGVGSFERIDIAQPHDDFVAVPWSDQDASGELAAMAIPAAELRAAEQGEISETAVEPAPSIHAPG